MKYNRVTLSTGDTYEYPEGFHFLVRPGRKPIFRAYGEKRIYIEVGRPYEQCGGVIRNSDKRDIRTDGEISDYEIY